MPTPKNFDASANLAELRERITGLVAHHAVAMVQCAIDGVLEEGQYQAIKYLFEMVGIYPAVGNETGQPEDSLSKILLKHLGVALPEGDLSSGGPDGHPVE